ncbi:MAG: efflux RND transporter periplasmic adaptor subunit [Candidatus Acidiferrales bacterium]
MVDRQEGGAPGPNAPPDGVVHTGSKHGALIAVVALLIVAAVVIAGIVPRLKARAALRITTYENAIPTVNVIRPKMGAPQNEIVLPGNIQAFNDSPIYARTDGYLKKWYVDIGAHVKAGQLLAEIETPEVDQQLDQARADLNTAQANLQLSKITAERYQGLAQSDSVSKQDVDNATSDFAAKKAMVASAQSNVGRLEELQAFEKIYAPFDGVITARNTDIGHLINSGAGSPATELFHLAAVQELRVYVNVPQEYSVSAKPGLKADLTLQEFPGKRFPGTLVRTADAIDQASRTLLVEVDVNNRTGELLPGAYAEVHLSVPSGAPTYLLPVSALIFRSAGLQVGTVQNGDKTKLVDITPGRDMGNEIEVVSGLNAGDFVIVNPPDSLISGETVRVVHQSASPGGTGNAASSNQE